MNRGNLVKMSGLVALLSLIPFSSSGNASWPIPIIPMQAEYKEISERAKYKQQKINSKYQSFSAKNHQKVYRRIHH